jgi:hypothetical protein
MPLKPCGRFMHSSQADDLEMSKIEGDEAPRWCKLDNLGLVEKPLKSGGVSVPNGI